MQLDKSLMRKIYHNGMVVALSAVYDLDNDVASYEVTKVLSGEVLSKFSTVDHSTANLTYDLYKQEIGAKGMKDNEEIVCNIE